MWQSKKEKNSTTKHILICRICGRKTKWDGESRIFCQCGNGILSAFHNERTKK